MFLDVVFFFFLSLLVKNEKFALKLCDIQQEWKEEVAIAFLQSNTTIFDFPLRNMRLVTEKKLPKKPRENGKRRRGRMHFCVNIEKKKCNTPAVDTSLVKNRTDNIELTETRHNSTHTTHERIMKFQYTQKNFFSTCPFSLCIYIYTNISIIIVKLMYTFHWKDLTVRSNGNKKVKMEQSLYMVLCVYFVTLDACLSFSPSFYLVKRREREREGTERERERKKSFLWTP